MDVVCPARQFKAVDLYQGRNGRRGAILDIARAGGSHMASQAVNPSTQLQRYLMETRLLDFNHPSLTDLARNRGWAQLSTYERIGRIYAFVQNEIAFGYNEADDIPASQVLKGWIRSMQYQGHLADGIASQVQHRVPVSCFHYR
jgi:hypothetical protein